MLKSVEKNKKLIQILFCYKQELKINLQIVTVSESSNNGYLGLGSLERSDNPNNEKVIKLSSHSHKRVREADVVVMSIISLFERCIDVYNILSGNYLDYKSFMSLRIACKYLYNSSMINSSNMFSHKVVRFLANGFLRKISPDKFKFLMTTSTLVEFIKVNHLKDMKFSLMLYKLIREMKDVKLGITISDNGELIQFIELISNKRLSIREGWIFKSIFRNVVGVDLSSIDIEVQNVEMIKVLLRFFSNEERMEKLALGNVKTELTLAELPHVKDVSFMNIRAGVIMEGLERLETILLRNIYSMLSLSKLPKLEMIRLWYIFNAMLRLEELPQLEKLRLEEMKPELINVINVPKLTHVDSGGKAIKIGG